MGHLKEFLDSDQNLRLRAFSSVFIVLAIVGGIILGGFVWSIIASAAALLSLWEFYKLQVPRLRLSPLLAMLSALFILFGAAAGLMDLSAILCALSAVAFVTLFLEVIRRQVLGESYALAAVGANVGGIAYIVLPWTFMMLTRSREHGAMFLLTLFCCTWCCDVAAYFTGSRFGKTLLCGNVSPHKTWEGFAGGAAASLMCGGLLSLIFSFPPLPLLLLGLLCGIAGQLGDLGESVLKREAGVKDTGSLIPGHGGMLDRFDSILVNGTLAFVIFELVG